MHADLKDLRTSLKNVQSKAQETAKDISDLEGYFGIDLGITSSLARPLSLSLSLVLCKVCHPWNVVPSHEGRSLSGPTLFRRGRVLRHP
jgi:hypothetical protein